MILSAKTMTDDFLTSSGGLIIGSEIVRRIKENSFEQIEVSFEHVDSVTPSFINGAFLYVIDLYGEAVFKERVKVRKASEQVASQIRNSVTKYIEYRNRKIG
jgi:hypothetical protein